METINVISIIVAIVIFAIFAIVTFLTTLLRGTNSKTSPYSFSRFQSWLWTLIVCPAFVLNLGFKNTKRSQINRTSLFLIAITVGIALTAGIVSAIQKASAKTSAKANILLKSTSTTEGFWIDILLDESGQF